VAKSLFDICCGLIALIVLAPLLGIIALLILLDSGSPVLYCGIRTGHYGKPFKMYKFRTMVVNAERLGGPSTGKNDPRLTRIGRYLRKCKLDELPQLVNVLNGEMSIVGPRPEVPQYTSLYTGEEQLILTVRPGITDYSSLKYIDLAEVLGSESVDTFYEERVRPEKNKLRIKYVRERTFWGDLKIILLTLYRILGRRSNPPLNPGH
jgi:lipopolysaccharide/colanic/teichoic acid biosynthesis glycosyltransferase